MASEEWALNFLGVPERSIKPRTRGLTVVRDHGIPVRAAEDMVESMGPFIDYVKVRQIWVMMATLKQDDWVIRKIRLYEENNIHAFTGGIAFETAYLRGKVDETFAVLCRMGFSAIELSDNIIDPTPAEKEKYTRQAVKCGLKVLWELGKKYASSSFDVQATADEARRVFDAEASLMVMERNELDLILGPKGEGGPEEHKLVELVEILGLERIVFEAESAAHQNWLFRTFGPDVNLGPNLAPERIPFLEALRRGFGREIGWAFVTDLAQSKSTKE